MKKDVIISIKGVQTIDKESDTVELVTNGKLMSKDGYYYINYKETEITGLKGMSTVVKANKDIVTITRKGKFKSQLVLEKGQRSTCYYDTEFGQLVMGVNTSDINLNMTENGGSLSVIYDLEINHQHASRNSFEISIR